MTLFDIVVTYAGQAAIGFAAVAFAGFAWSTGVYCFMRLTRR
jgi:hypothetical protein